MFDMRRREFITLLGGAAATPSMFWPRSAGAEQAPKAFEKLYTEQSERGRTLQ